MSKTRAIRFSDEEERQIEEFLRNNSFLDFSSLARLAILNFIKEPKITIRPNKESRLKIDRGQKYDQPKQ